MSNAILINCFEVAPEQDERFLALWEQADELLRSRGGYRSTRLHEAMGPPARFRYVNVAELDSVEAWQSVIGSPEFGAIAAQMADFHPSPGLYTLHAARTAALLDGQPGQDLHS
jgi:antibiotic biosynthesis monooxygenase (ABM) superfamily enzyme